MSPQSRRTISWRKRRPARPSNLGPSRRPNFERQLLPRPCRAGAGRGGSSNARSCARALPSFGSSVDGARGSGAALGTVPHPGTGKKGGSAARISYDKCLQADGRRDPQPAHRATNFYEPQDQAGASASPLRRRRLRCGARSARLAFSGLAGRPPTPARRPSGSGILAAGQLGTKVRHARVE